jgi:hypothetical protein
VQAVFKTEIAKGPYLSLNILLIIILCILYILYSCDLLLLFVKSNEETIS